MNCWCALHDMPIELLIKYIINSFKFHSIKFVALQAPVSDRESITLTSGDHDGNLQHAKSLVAANKGDEMMPRSSFWAPM